jgi:hypothetical protein
MQWCSVRIFVVLGRFGVARAAMLLMPRQLLFVPALQPQFVKI